MKSKEQIEQRIAKKREEIKRIGRTVEEWSDESWQHVDELAIEIAELEWVLEKR